MLPLTAEVVAPKVTSSAATIATLCALIVPVFVTVVANKAATPILPANPPSPIVPLFVIVPVAEPLVNLYVPLLKSVSETSEVESTIVGALIVPVTTIPFGFTKKRAWSPVTDPAIVEGFISEILLSVALPPVKATDSLFATLNVPQLMIAFGVV